MGESLESKTESIVPDNLSENDLALYQNKLAIERTELSRVRTELSFHNSRLAVDQTHLAYLRTIVTLVGTAATVYKALPILGISLSFSMALAGFLMLFAIYFIYKDATTYSERIRCLNELEEKTKQLELQTEPDMMDNEL